MKSKAMLIVASLVVCLFFQPLLRADAEEAEKIAYTISFVDAGDYDQKIFNTQSGSVFDGEVISVTYPNQIIGSDGYRWIAVLNSPQSFQVHQAGIHKYYVEYAQGEKVKGPEAPEAAQKEILEKWLTAAWKADCTLTGQNPDGEREPYLTVSTDSENNSRIKNLISMITDSEWHYFYMIGKNYTPKTVVIGTDFDAAYTAVTEETFTIGKDKYRVVKVGVRRNWNPEKCVHEWTTVSASPVSCLENGTEFCKCSKCQKEETTILPAAGHRDANGDSLCDNCGKRAFAQELGSVISTTIKAGVSEKALSFTCIDEDYKGSGKMLYLADEALEEEITGYCFADDSDYNDSSIRKYFNLAFVNSSSIGAALQPINREDGNSLIDYAALFSKAEYETFKDKGVIKETQNGYFLRTFEGNKILAVNPDGSLEAVSANGNNSFGARPFILLNKPDTGEVAEPRYWKTGDIQMRKVGKKIYRFTCVDEDYSDNQDGHRKAALFLCDNVIRADIDSDNFTFKTFSFGADNNYKTSAVRKWLRDNSTDSSFNLEPIYIGVNTAYTGSTQAGTFEQLTENHLASHDIGFQLLQDKLFNLSLEEAVKYKNSLWRFNGSTENNPETQISPYSAGYYLRTPFYAENDTGTFQYSKDVYVVDLTAGNIHTARTDSETYGLRPAFTMPQE